MSMNKIPCGWAWLGGSLCRSQVHAKAGEGRILPGESYALLPLTGRRQGELRTSSTVREDGGGDTVRVMGCGVRVGRK
jgi:hypothetical protein